MSVILSLAALASAPICGPGVPTSSVAIAAEDHSSLESFYVDTLGFAVDRRLEFEGIDPILILSCGTLSLEIVPAGGPIPPRPDGGGLNAGPFKFGVVTPDFDAAHAALIEAGIEFDFGPVTDDSGIRFLMFRDPKGNRIQLFDTLTPESADKEAIAQAAQAFSAAYVAEDIETLVGFYTEDGVGIPNANPHVVGRTALLEYWQVGEGVDVLRHKTASDELVIEGDLAYDRGTFEGAVERGGETSEFGGNYLIVWRRGEDGRWRMAQDMWANR